MDQAWPVDWVQDYGLEAEVPAGLFAEVPADAAPGAAVLPVGQADGNWNSAMSMTAQRLMWGNLNRFFDR